MYQQEALNYYVSEIKKLNKVDNEENLIAKIYQSKINAIEKFNDIYNLNIDTFNNPEYKTWYTRTKSDLEGKFIEIENQKLQENSQNSEQICQQLLNKHYAIINQKISAGKYNGNNTDEYLKDYETENQSKLLDANKRLEDSKKRKKQQEEQYKQLNDKTEENSKRVEDISSQIERKKREIKNLNSEIERVEEELRKAQAEDNGSGQPL